MDPTERHQQKVRQVLGGQEAPLIDGERSVLGQCHHSGRVWLQRGTTSLLHLTVTDQETWAQRLHADLSHLPRRLCRACQLRLVGGEFAIDEYSDAQRGKVTGYGVSWECGAPPQHLLVSAVLLRWLERQDEVPKPSIVTDAALARAILRFLAHLSLPGHMHPFEAAMLTMLTHTTPPGAHAPGTDDWRWHGVLWTVHCPALGDDVIISFAQALPPTAHFSLDAVLALWRQITLHVLQFGIESV